MSTTPKHLVTVDQVLDALGGTSAVKDLVDAKYWQQVDNWRSRGRFASHVYLVMTTALQGQGYTADPLLWGITPAKADAAESVPG